MHRQVGHRPCPATPVVLQTLGPDGKMKRPAFLYIGGSGAQSASIRAISEQGIVSVLTDISPDAPARKDADRFEGISATDADSLMDLAGKLAEDYDLLGAYAGADHAYPAIGEIVDKLGLVQGPSMAYGKASDKVTAAEIWEKTGIRVPEMIWCGTREGLTPEGDPTFLENPDAAIVIKPSNMDYSRGVSMLSVPDRYSIRKALDGVFEHAEEAVIQKIAEGDLVNVDGLMVDGGYYTLTIIERHIHPNGRCQNFFGISPAPLAAATEHALHAQAAQAARALGLQNGLFTIDVIVNGTELTLLELSPHSTVNGDGFKAWLAYLQGDPDWRHKLPEEGSREVVAYTMFYAERPGVVTDIEGLKTQRARPDVTSFDVLREPGKEVREINGFRDICAKAWLTGDAYDSVRNAIRDIHQNLRFKTTQAN